MKAAVALVVALSAASAHAETIGVVVTGDDAMVAPVTQRVATYLRDHERKAVGDPLPADAVTALTSCFVLGDEACARSVVETRSSTETTLVIAVDATGRDLAFTGRWFVKGNDIHTEHGACEDCRRDAWHPVVDGLMAALVPMVAPETGHLTLRSTPSGLGVVIDTTRVGTTPLEHDLTVGDHEIELRRGTHPVANRTVTITEDTTTELDIPVADDRPPPPPRSRVGPAIAIGLGAVALGAGAWFLYYGEIGGRDDKMVYAYYEQAPLIGGALATLGAATLVSGIVLYTRAGAVVTPTPGGAALSWTGRF